jgi:hypothetical protein
MPFDDDDDQFGELNADAARNQVIFEDFLEQLGVDPDEMLATFHTNVAKVRNRFCRNVHLRPFAV